MSPTCGVKSRRKSTSSSSHQAIRPRPPGDAAELDRWTRGFLGISPGKIGENGEKWWFYRVFIAVFHHFSLFFLFYYNGFYSSSINQQWDFDVCCKSGGFIAQLSGQKKKRVASGRQSWLARKSPVLGRSSINGAFFPGGRGTSLIEKAEFPARKSGSASLWNVLPQLLVNSSKWPYGYAAMPQTSQTIKMDGFNIKPSAKFLRLVDKNITLFMNSYPDIMVKGSQNLWSWAIATE